MPESYSDPDLDQQLRDVTIPDGLVRRLRRPDVRNVLCWTEQQLDDEIADVVLPESLVSRLKDIPDDVELDELIRNVDIPWSLTVQLRLPEHSSRRLKLGHIIRAAMIFLAIGALYHLSVGLLLSGLRPESEDQTVLNVQYDGPLEIEAVPEIQLQFAFERREVSPLAVDLSVDPPPKLDPAIAAPSPAQTIAAGPAGELIRELNDGLDLDADVFFVRYGALGYPQRTDDSLPRFEEPPRAPRGGIEPPLVRGFNRRFLLKYGVNPPVFPGLNASLRTSVAPLTTSTDSFDLAKRRLDDNRLPGESEVAVEDFIAAATFCSSRPAAGSLKLKVAGAPSIFGERRGSRVVKDLGWRPGPAHLLQVSTVTGPIRRSSRPVQITVALDISSSMRWDGRLDTAKTAIQHLASQLGSKDRISVLAFNERVERHIEGVSREGRSHLSEFLDRLRADGGTNLPRALQLALSSTFDSAIDMDAEPVLVLITDGRADFPNETLRRLSQMFEVAAEQGLRFDILEMNEDYDADPALDELRKALHGDKRTAVDSRHVKRALLEALAGSSTLLAADAKLTVSFNPQVVLAYRLIGHDASAGAGLVPAAVEANLHAGEVATSLFEVWLRPGTRGQVGQARLQWTDAETGRRRRKSHDVETSDFDAAFLSAPPSLQSVAIAAETAETLRGSPLSASRNRDLDHVLEVTERLSSVPLLHCEFQDLLRFVEQAERVRQARLAPEK